MSDIQIHKLDPLRLSTHVADLLLAAEGSIESVRESRTRFAWHLFFFSFIGIILSQTLLGRVFAGPIQQSTELTQVWRIFLIAGSLWLLGAAIFLAYRHYRFMLLTKKDLRFQNIAFFFFVGVFLFGWLYRDLYVLSPDLFVYANPIVVPTANSTSLNFLTSLQFTYDFILYSASTAASVGYPRIASASALVSFVNFIQVITNFLIVALLVATFVQHAQPSSGA